MTWTAPRSDRPITKYHVQYRRIGTTSWIIKDVTSRNTTLENLIADTSYQVQVRAVSDVGTGPYSDMRTQITHQGMIVTTALMYSDLRWMQKRGIQTFYYDMLV